MLNGSVVVSRNVEDDMATVLLAPSVRYEDIGDCYKHGCKLNYGRV